MRRRLVIGLAVGSVACEGLLGGLEDGKRSADASVAPTPSTVDAAKASPACAGWLRGARYRRRLIVRSSLPLVRHPVRFSLDTLRLRREGKVAGDERPGLVVASEAGAIAPYVYDGLSWADAAPIYAALEVRAGETAYYVYYGADVDGGPRPSGEVFVPGIVADGAFADPGARSWSALPFGRGVGYELRIEGGRARFSMLGRGEGTGHPVGFCQYVTFPAGRSYKVVYDAGSQHSPRQFRVTRAGLDGEPLGTWDPIAEERSIVAGPIPAGDAMLCFVAQRLSIETVVDFWISNVRVAPWVAEEPAVVGLEREERCDDG